MGGKIVGPPKSWCGLPVCSGLGPQELHEDLQPGPSSVQALTGPSVCASWGAAVHLEASLVAYNPLQGHHRALQREKPADQGTHVPCAEEAL